jgi:putative iron-regulated protein
VEVDLLGGHGTGTRVAIGRRLGLIVVCLAIASVAAAEPPASRPAADSLSSALQGYARTAFQGYSEAVAGLETLQVAVDTLLAHPSRAALERARAAWIACRDPYSRTEPFRFAGGPIDDRQGREGRINPWPIDEAFLDYVQGRPGSGVISDRRVAIDQASLTSLNERDDDTQVTLGYHAVEFLLWGQDLRRDGPGARPYTDYLPGQPVRERRRACLGLLVQLLLSDVRSVRDAWDPARGGYVREFLAGDPLVALGHALSGPATLAAFELGSERVGIPLESGEQEDEQDCFSDNTHRDIASDIAGIARVLEGNGDTPGLLVAVGGKPAAEVREHLGRLLNLVPRIPAPIDAVLVSPQEDPRRRILEALVGELIGLAGAIQRAGTAAGAHVVIGGG